MAENHRESDFKILVIDDHVTSAVGISNSLEFYSFKTFQAYSFEEGVKQIKSCNPDLVLLDLFLENKSGLEMVKLFPKHKFLLMSNDGLEKFKKPSNVSTILHKPIDNSALFEAVRIALKLPKRPEQVFAETVLQLNGSRKGGG